MSSRQSCAKRRPQEQPCRGVLQVRRPTSRCSGRRLRAAAERVIVGQPVMTRDPAGIARDSCPYCGERIGVPWYGCLGGRLTCVACRKTVTVSPGVAVLGLVVGFVSGGGFLLGLIRHLGVPLAMIGTLVVVILVASAVTRALLRLETLDYGDRGGPS